MPAPFRSARLKVQRAGEHIEDLRTKAESFGTEHPHRLSVSSDPTTGHDILSIAPAEPYPEEYLLILGDALHNLRSALDHAWYETVSAPSDWTRFPFEKSRDELVNKMKSMGERISEKVKEFILDTVQPYEDGRTLYLFGLHHLDIDDKHRFLLIHRQYGLVTGIKAKDTDNGEEFAISSWLTVPPHTASQEMREHPHFRIIDEGQSNTFAYFGKGSCLEGRRVLPTLFKIREIVSRTIDMLEMLKTDGI